MKHLLISVCLFALPVAQRSKPLRMMTCVRMEPPTRAVLNPSNQLRPLLAVFHLNKHVLVISTVSCCERLSWTNNCDIHSSYSLLILAHIP